MRVREHAVTLVRGVAAGAVGTAAMTATGQAYRRAYAWRHGIPARDITDVLDYDDSDHVVVAACAVVRRLGGRAPSTPRGERALFALTHWGYGSAVGAAHAELRTVLGEPAAGTVFFAGCQTMACSLFPLLGGTPPPWRWERRLLVVSVVQHVVYAAAVAATDALLQRR